MAPPRELPDHVSRAEAASLLGYPSIFRVRQLEHDGRLKAARGVMGSAWYPRRDVLALRERERGSVAGPVAMTAPASARRRTDAELVAYLRRAGAPAPAERPPTVADLVADMGVSIVRAQKVYRFWLAHDAHPTADQARSGLGNGLGTGFRTGFRTGLGAPASPSPDSPSAPSAAPAERRSPDRLQRGALIRQLRAADPAQRAAAFAALKNARPPADGR